MTRQQEAAGQRSGPVACPQCLGICLLDPKSEQPVPSGLTVKHSTGVTLSDLQQLERGPRTEILETVSE